MLGSFYDSFVAAAGRPGAFSFPAIFKQLKKMGYTGCVNLEYEINGKDPMMGMQRSLSFERGVLAALAAA